MKGLLCAVMVGLAASAGAEQIKCFLLGDHGRSEDSCYLVRLDRSQFNYGEDHPWWKCCAEDRNDHGGMTCRPGFEMYPDTKPCAVPCNATKQQLADSAKCYQRFLDREMRRK